MEFIDGKDYTLVLRGTGFSEGHYKERRCKNLHGGEVYCMSEGERWRNLRRHTVYLVAVMHEFGARGELVNLETTLSFLILCQFGKRCV